MSVGLAFASPSTPGSHGAWPWAPVTVSSSGGAGKASSSSLPQRHPGPMPGMEAQPGRSVPSHMSVLTLGTATAGAALALRRHSRARASNKLEKRRWCASVLRRAAKKDFDLEAWRKGWREYGKLEEGYYFLEDVPGLPSDIKGSYYRNGPGKLFVAGVPVRHQLDGDGVVLGISFDGEGRVCVRHREVRTQGFLREASWNRVSSNGAFGTKAEGGKPWDLGQLRSKNTANSGCFWFRDRFMALWQFGKPHLMDPASLGTEIGAAESGATDLGGSLDQGIGFGHRPRVTSEQELQSFYFFPTPLNTMVTFLDYKPDSWLLRYRKPRSIDVDGYANFLDFGSTKKWFFVVKAPQKLTDSFAAAFGAALTEVLEFDPSGKAELLLITRDQDDGEEVQVELDEALSCSQIVDSFDAEDGSVVFTAIMADRWDLGKPSDGSGPPRWLTEDPSQEARTRLVRYEVNPKTKTFNKKVLLDRHVGFATLNPAALGSERKYAFLNVAHSEDEAGPMAGIAKVDLSTGEASTWVPGPAEFAGEPTFIPRTDGSGEEDDGYLLSVLFNGASEESEVVILDAKQVSNGPVCRFKLQEAVPHGLRGCWRDGLFFTQEQMKNKTVLLRMFERKANSWNSMDKGFQIISKNPFFEKQGGKLR